MPSTVVWTAAPVATAYNSQNAVIVPLHPKPFLWASMNPLSNIVSNLPPKCQIRLPEERSQQQKQQQEKISSQQPMKKLKTTSTATSSSSPQTNITTLLHEATRCLGPNLSIATVNSILSVDPKAVLRPLQLKRRKRIYRLQKNDVQEVTVPEQYQYALNLAILYGAPYPVLEALVKAGPGVLSKTDGTTRSLHILLRHQPNNTDALNLLLLTELASVTWTDDRSQTALHAAVRYGAPLSSIRHLVALHPEAITSCDRSGQTPLSLSFQHTSEEVCQYLQDQYEQRDVIRISPTTASSIPNSKTTKQQQFLKKTQFSLKQIDNSSNTSPINSFDNDTDEMSCMSTDSMDNASDLLNGHFI